MIGSGAYLVSVVLTRSTHTCVVILLVDVSVYLLFKIIGRIDAIVVYTVCIRMHCGSRHPRVLRYVPINGFEPV